MTLSDEDIREILRLIDESDVDELSIQTDSFSLYVRRGPGSPISTAPRNKGAVETGPPGPPEAPGLAKPTPQSAPPSAEPPLAEPPVAEAPEPAGPPPPAEEESQRAEGDGVVTIDSPMLGTFYRAQAPGAAPFVEVGSRVEPDTIVCIIEVMKMMNSIPAGVSGEVLEVLPENAALVEYGEPLFRVQPA